MHCRLLRHLLKILLSMNVRLHSPPPNEINLKLKVVPMWSNEPITQCLSDASCWFNLKATEVGVVAEAHLQILRDFFHKLQIQTQKVTVNNPTSSHQNENPKSSQPTSKVLR